VKIEREKINRKFKHIAREEEIVSAAKKSFLDIILLTIATPPLT